MKKEPFQMSCEHKAVITFLVALVPNFRYLNAVTVTTFRVIFSVLFSWKLFKG